MTTGRRWLVTGASRGIGRALVEELLARGERVAATARNAADLARLPRDNGERLLTLKLDVTDGATITAAVQQTVARFGGIDVLVNNAGYGFIGAIEEASDAEIAGLFETNVFGLLRVVRMVLPTLRAQRSGHIVNVGSISGLIGTAGSGLYCASKFAVAGISESLAAELAPLGIRVTVVEPGAIRSDFLGSSYREAGRVIADYADTAGHRRVDAKALNGRQPGDPVRVACVIVDTVEADTVPLHLVLGASAHQRAVRKLEDARAELNDWADVARGIDFDDEETTA